MKIAVFDIDGVMADFEGQLVKAIEKTFGIMNQKRHLFRLEDRYEGEVLKYAKELTADPNFYYPLEPNESALGLADFLMDNEYLVRFVSSRPASARTFTKRWLKKHLPDRVFFLACGVVDKSEYLFNMSDKSEIEFVIEDNPEQIINLKNEGFNVYCWEQDWNIGVFPRLYERADGTMMFWCREDIEAVPFSQRDEV